MHLMGGNPGLSGLVATPFQGPEEQFFVLITDLPWL